MNPKASRSGRSRVLRIVVNLLMVPLWALITFISINSFVKYTEVGDVTLLALIMLFAVWAWWYAEDRERRRAAKQSAPDREGDSPPADQGDGHSPSAT
jgi:hypothetical protein